MAGTAVLGSNLIDSLASSLIDELRGALHPVFGVRQFNVYTVLRTWTGRRGDKDAGGYTDIETLLEPQPKVEPYKTEMRLKPCGISDAGVVQLREISFTYTERELTGVYGSTGAALTNKQEWLYKITDAYGQGIEDSYWVVSTRPYPDREKTMGLTMELRKK